MEIGYWLSSEEHSPRRLVENAQRAEDAGFSYVLISDHFHPWVDAQGHSPFVWSVIGAIAQATERVRVGTAVTCPLIRMHPAIVAQAAATSALLMEGRFFLGVGSGELLNEHILGDRWPRPDERLDMLDEALQLIRTLWKGDYETFRGKHYTVEQARLYDVPDRPPELIVAAAAEHAAKLAAKWGDGMISTSPDGALVDEYRRAGGTAPIYGKVTGCFAADREDAKRVAKERSPNSAIGGSVSQDSRSRATSKRSQSWFARTISRVRCRSGRIRELGERESRPSRNSASHTSVSTTSRRTSVPLSNSQSNSSCSHAPLVGCI